jgi:RimJ/RimL family protein N-acetyltransferase
MHIREATEQDWPAIWPFFQDIVKACETYAFDPQMTADEGRHIWMSLPRTTLVFEEDGQILGSYFLKSNQAGPGDHVCNCGYMVSPAARGRGLATAMCEHSKLLARELGYQAMQFNCVVASNTGAVRLWHKLGFDTVGRLPGAFKHPRLGYVDALVMYQWLGDQGQLNHPESQ